MYEESKGLIGTIVAAVVVTGIGVGGVVGSLAGRHAAHVQTTLQHHEQRVNDSTNAVIMEFQMLLHALQDGRQERMSEFEDWLAGRGFDTPRGSPHSTAHFVVARLYRIQHELTDLMRALEAREVADAAVTHGAAEALDGIEGQVGAIRTDLSPQENAGE